MLRRPIKKQSPALPHKTLGFLDLPPETRNQIYELACKDIEEVNVGYGDVIRLLQHPFARTCRQVQEEFTPMFEANAFQRATKFTCLTTNLDIGGMRLRNWLTTHVPASKLQLCEFMLKSTLDQDFEKGVRENAWDLYRRPFWYWSQHRIWVISFGVTISVGNNGCVANRANRLGGIDLSLYRELFEDLRDAIAHYEARKAVLRREEKRRNRLQKRKSKKAKKARRRRA